MTPCVAEILQSPELNRVYRLTSEVSALPVIDANVATNKQKLLEAIGDVLGFPAYYGANWDALEECLTDMSWRSGPVGLHVTHAAQLPAEVLETLVALFTDVANYWAERGQGCSLFLSGFEGNRFPTIRC